GDRGESGRDVRGDAVGCDVRQLLDRVRRRDADDQPGDNQRRGDVVGQSVRVQPGGDVLGVGRPRLWRRNTDGHDRIPRWLDTARNGGPGDGLGPAEHEWIERRLALDYRALLRRPELCRRRAVDDAPRLLVGSLLGYGGHIVFEPGGHRSEPHVDGNGHGVRRRNRRRGVL